MKKFKQVLSLLLVIVMIGTSAFIMSCNDNDENDRNDNNDDLTNLDTNDDFEWEPHELSAQELRNGFENLARGELPIVINAVGGRPASRLNDGNYLDRGDEGRWASDSPALRSAMGDAWNNGYRNVWFGMSFFNLTTFDTVIVVEADSPGRDVGQWVLEVGTFVADPNGNNNLDDFGWEIVAEGTGLGEARVINFHPVASNYVRVRTLTTEGSHDWPPSIAHFEVYNVSDREMPHIFETIEQVYELPRTGVQMRNASPNIALYPHANPIAISTVGTRPLERLNDGDFEDRGGSGRWATDTPALTASMGDDWLLGYRNIWFGVDLLYAQEFNALVVTETSDRDPRRVARWVIEVAEELDRCPNDNRNLSADGWTIVAEGEGVGDQRVIHLDEAVTARYVRMRSITTTGTHDWPPSMVQFEVFYAVPAPPITPPSRWNPVPEAGERDTTTLEVVTLRQSQRHYTENANLPRSNRSDHQPLGFILPAGDTVRVRQTNPNFNYNLTIDTWGTRNHTNNRAGTTNVPSSGEWVFLRSLHPAPNIATVPTVRTPFVADNNNQVPVLEFEIVEGAWDLPVYEYSNSRIWNANNRDFTQVAAWDAWNNPGSNAAHINFVNSLTDEPFALIQGNSINILLNAHDIEHSVRARLNGPNGGHLRHFVNFDQLLGYYDHMTAMFDFWSGLDPSHHADSNFSFIWEEAGADLSSIDPRHDTPHTRFFSIADQGGIGAGYWAGTHMGQSASSQESFYMRRGWGGLHEVGHAYQGRHKSGSHWGEVWNNILAHTYQLRYVLPTHPLVAFPGQTLEASRARYALDFANSTDTVPSGYGMNSWMWGNVRPSNGHTVRSRVNAETEMHRRRLDPDFAHQNGFENRLYTLVLFTELIGEAGFREVNRLHREMQATNQHGINDIQDNGAAWTLVAGLALGLDFSDFFAAFGFTISPRIRTMVAEMDTVYFLMDVRIDEATRAQIVEANDLASEFAVVTESMLREAGVQEPFLAEDDNDD